MEWNYDLTNITEAKLQQYSNLFLVVDIEIIFLGLKLMSMH